MLSFIMLEVLVLNEGGEASACCSPLKNVSRP